MGEGRCATASRRAHQLVVIAKFAFTTATDHVVDESVKKPRTVGMSWSLRTLGNELRHAWRRLRHEPLFVFGTVVALGGGLGATALMLGIIGTLFLRAPGGLIDSGRLTRLFVVTQDPVAGRSVSATTSFPVFADQSEAKSAFVSVAAYALAMEQIGQGSAATPGRVGYVTSQYFEVLGVKPILGRLVSQQENAATTPSLAVISEGFWRRSLGGDPKIIGSELRVSGRLYTVTAVTPRDFSGAEATPVDAWLPLDTYSRPSYTSPHWATDRTSFWVSIVARLRAGVSRPLASAIGTKLMRQRGGGSLSTDTLSSVIAASIIPGQDPDRPAQLRVALWLGGVSGLLLLMAYANVAALLILRAMRQGQDFAVRIALGATRRLLGRQVLAEMLVLAALSGAVALLIVLSGTPLIEHLLLPKFAWPTLGTNDPIGIATFGAAICLSVPMCIVVLRTGYRNPARALRSSPVAGSPISTRASTVLIALETGVCTILLFGGLLFALSLHRVMGLDLGVDLQHTLFLSFDVSGQGLQPTEVQQLYGEMLTSVRAVQGVDHAALAESNPYAFGRAMGPYTDQKSFSELWRNREPPYVVAVGADFFASVGTQSLRGRDFKDSDRFGNEPVAVVNAPLARLLWGDEDPVGKCLRLEDGKCAAVIGVQTGVWKFSILQRNKLALFVSLAQDTSVLPGGVLVHTRGNVATLAKPLRSIAARIAPQLPVDITFLRDIAGREYRPWQLGAAMFAVYGLLSVVIATVGLYSLIGYATLKRRHEIGLRVALGAQHRAVYFAVAGRNLLAALGGAFGGALVAVAASRWTAGLLFETSSRDPALLGVTVMFLVVVSMVASFAPIARELRRSPASILKAT
jgi:predicted permease